LGKGKSIVQALFVFRSPRRGIVETGLASVDVSVARRVPKMVAVYIIKVADANCTVLWMICRFITCVAITPAAT
jgi:hypothetical protein